MKAPVARPGRPLVSTAPERRFCSGIPPERRLAQIGTLSLAAGEGIALWPSHAYVDEAPEPFLLGGHLAPTTPYQARDAYEVLIVLAVAPTLCLLAAERLNKAISKRHRDLPLSTSITAVTSNNAVET